MIEFLKCLVQYSADPWRHSLVQRECEYQSQLAQTKDRGFSFNVCQFRNVLQRLLSVSKILYHKQIVTKVCKWFACITLIGREIFFVVRPDKCSTD